MAVELDPSQRVAVDRALKTVRRGGVFKLLGKAGTGKTTVGLTIVEELIEAGYQVVSTAFTNKAVNRMVEVGYPKQGSRTLNRLLYKTALSVEVDGYQFSDRQADSLLRLDYESEHAKRIFDDAKIYASDEEKASETITAATGNLRWRLHQKIKRGDGSRTSGLMPKTEEDLRKEGLSRKTVIVCDELSMVPIDMADDLHGTFDSVIFIGDPGQLPPVNSVDTCRYLSADDTVELTTIHRVSGNEHLLNTIYSLDNGEIPEGVAAISQGTFELMANEDYQFICYTNNGVAWINEHVRRVRGLYGQDVHAGEPLITVTRTSAQRNVTINDENRAWFLENQRRLEDQYESSRGQSGAVYHTVSSNGLETALEIESVTIYRMLPKNTTMIASGPPTHEKRDMWIVPVEVDGKVWLVKTVPFWVMDQRRKKAFRKVGSSMTVDFAYAITAHKAQGSEWPKVAVMLRQPSRRDIGDAEMTDEIKRWNYTAATEVGETSSFSHQLLGAVMDKLKNLFWKIFGPRYWITEEDILAVMKDHGPNNTFTLAMDLLENKNITCNDVHNWQFFHVLESGAKKGLWVKYAEVNRLTGRSFCYVRARKTLTNWQQ